MYAEWWHMIFVWISLIFILFFFLYNLNFQRESACWGTVDQGLLHHFYPTVIHNENDHWIKFYSLLGFDPVSIKVQFHSNCICAFYWPLISHSSQNFDRLKGKICKLARRLFQSRFFFLVTCCSYEFLSYLTVWLLTYGTPLQ